MPDVAAEVVREEDARIEVEVPRVEVAVRVRDGRPEAAVRNGFVERSPVERSPVAVAAAGEEDAGGGVRAFAFCYITFDAVLRSPSPITLAAEIREFLVRRHPPAAGRGRHRVRR